MERPLLATRWFQHGLICIAVSLCAHFSIVLAMTWRSLPTQTNVGGESIVIEFQLSEEDSEALEELVVVHSPPVVAIAVADAPPQSKQVETEPVFEPPPPIELTAAAPQIQESATPEPNVLAVNASTPIATTADKAPQRSDPAAETTGKDRPTVERVSLLEVMAATRPPAREITGSATSASLASFAIPDDQPKRGSQQREAFRNAEEPPADDLGETEPQAEFFGVQATGDRFAFVVDCSVSMGGEKWINARKELIRSLERLNEHQFFYVVFFDGESHCMPMFADGKQADGMMAASAENVDRFRDWLDAVRLGAETRPYRSVRDAFERNPDAIFFLSDGAFADQTLTFLRGANLLDDGSVKSPVHAISFEKGRGSALLKRMAEENGGQFKAVWRR